MIVRKSAFISFDYDNDKDICGFLRAQSEDPKVAFSISDWSLMEPVTEKWKDKVRDIIRRVDLTIVLCGERERTPGRFDPISSNRQCGSHGTLRIPVGRVRREFLDTGCSRGRDCRFSAVAFDHQVARRSEQRQVRYNS